MRFSLLAAGLFLLLVSGTAWSAGEAEGAADAERVTITYMRSEHPSSPINPDAPVYQAIREHNNIDLQIEAIPSGDFNAKVQLLLGTAQLPDIMRITQRQVNDFADSGVFLALNEPVKNQAPALWQKIEAVPDVKKTWIDGTMYYVPQLNSFKFLLGPVPNIRRDLLDDLGLEMPDNFDELYEVLAAFKREFPDSQPWSNRSGTRNLLNRSAFPMGMGWNIHWVPSEQRWVYGTVKPEFRSVLEYFRRAYEEGVLDPDFAINSSSQWHEKLGSGKSLFYYDNMTFALNYTLSLRQVKPDALFWPVPVMENQFGQRRNYFYSKHWLTSGFVVSAASEHHDRIMDLFNWMGGGEGEIITNWGIEGEHWHRVDGEIEALPEVLDTYRGASDPQRAMRAALGTGLLQFALVVDQKPIYYFDPPEVSDWYAQINSDPNMILPVLPPAFNEEERERLKRLITDVDNILNPALDGFIVGTLPMDEFDSVMEQAIAAGAEEIEEIYNNADARLR